MLFLCYVWCIRFYKLKRLTKLGKTKFLNSIKNKKLPANSYKITLITNLLRTYYK